MSVQQLRLTPAPPEANWADVGEGENQEVRSLFRTSWFFSVKAAINWAALVTAENKSGSIRTAGSASVHPDRRIACTAATSPHWTYTKGRTATNMCTIQQCC